MLLNLLQTQPYLFFAIILAIVISLTFHEYAHALAASLLGDSTAERMGRLTLNPIAHLDPVGFLMLLMVGFGYARPVPYNPASLKNPARDSVLIGIAGPASNIVLAVIFAIVLRLLWDAFPPGNLLIQFLYIASFININLAIFNLIPIPPLDGSKILLSFMRAPKWRNARIALEAYGPYVLILLLMLDAVSGIGMFSILFNAFGSLFFGALGIPL